MKSKLTLNKVKRDKDFQKTKKEFIEAILSDVPAENTFDYITWRTGYLSTSFTLQPDESCYQMKPGLLEMVEKGVSVESILDVVRVAKAEALFNAFTRIENFSGHKMKRKKWALYFLDKEGNPKHEIVESDLSHDFIGDDFLPRKKTKSTKLKRK
jgi:hypothetical protein